MRRRIFLKRLLTVSATFLTGVSGVLKSITAFAKWNAEAFSSITEQDAIAKFFPGEKILPSDAINIGAYDFVENGAVVPVKIDTDLPDIKSITILVDKNPNPLIASFNLAPECSGFVATRIKMNESSNIIAIVNSAGNLFSTRKFVEVAEGGCG